MQHTWAERSLALAGMFQCIHLINQIALNGSHDEAEAEPLLKSLFQFEPVTVEDVYGGTSGLKEGLRIIVNYCHGLRTSIPVDCDRYLLGLITLESKLRRNHDMIQHLELELPALFRQKDERNVQELVPDLARLYLGTVGKLRPRIVVKGRKAHLEQEQSTATVRALLFAGIRSAWLWRQLGVNRLALIFYRSTLAQEAQRWLHHVDKMV